MPDLLAAQSFLYPTELERLVTGLTYKPGWSVRLREMDRGQDSSGLTLVITTNTRNSYDMDGYTSVQHLMIVPAAAYDARSWRAWLLDQYMAVESHECCEFFTIDGEKPYAPSHGPGNDPYLVREIGTDEDVRTSFRGVLKEKEVK